tara:strand:+ start:638 stop:1198 length:561 start_codon:yes stop_codon:yes gene_type:complete
MRLTKLFKNVGLNYNTMSDRMPNRVAFVGAFGSGKTHMADHLCSNNNFTKFSFATGLKIVARDYYGVSVGGPKPRELYQKLGDAMRSVNKDVFAMRTLREIENFQAGRRDWEPVKPVVVDDLRFKNEADFLKKAGFVIIRINPREMLEESELRNHRSETEMFEIETDFEITSGDYLQLINVLNISQ